MAQMTTDQYLDQIQSQLLKTLTEKKDAMPPGFNRQRFALNCITVIRDMMKDYKKRDQLQTVDINSIVLCMLKGAYLGLDFLNGECYAIPYKGEMTFQTDYKGEIKVCKRFSDDPIKDIYAKVVREGDTYDEGVEAGVQKLNFKPVPFSNKDIIGAFAVVMYADGTIKYERPRDPAHKRYLLQSGKQPGVERVIRRDVQEDCYSQTEQVDRPQPG